MDDDEIRQIIDVLERQAEQDAGKSRLLEAKPERCTYLLANRSGLLRWATVMLRAAIEPIVEDERRSKPISLADLQNQVCDSMSDCWLAFVQRMETWPEPAESIGERKRRAWWRDRVALFTCGIVATILIVVFCAGVMTLWSMLFRGK